MPWHYDSNNDLVWHEWSDEEVGCIVCHRIGHVCTCNPATPREESRFYIDTDSHGNVRHPTAPSILIQGNLSYIPQDLEVGNLFLYNGTLCIKTEDGWAEVRDGHYIHKVEKPIQQVQVQVDLHPEREDPMYRFVIIAEEMDDD